MDLRHFMAVEDQNSVTLHVVSPWLKALPNCRDTISGLFNLPVFPTMQQLVLFRCCCSFSTVISYLFSVQYRDLHRSGV